MSRAVLESMLALARSLQSRLELTVTVVAHWVMVTSTVSVTTEVV